MSGTFFTFPTTESHWCWSVGRVKSGRLITVGVFSSKRRAKRFARTANKAQDAVSSPSMAELHRVLVETYKPEGVEIWLRAAINRLGDQS